MNGKWCVEQRASGASAEDWFRIFPSGDDEWSSLDDTVRALVEKLRMGEPGISSTLRVRGEAGAVYAATQILEREV